MPLSIGIDSSENQSDILRYATLRLKDVGKRGDMGESWPDDVLCADFAKRAEGLFLWIFTIYRYLCTVVNPDKNLKQILSRSGSQGLRAEKKMEELYTSILNTCNWEDEDFVEGYRLVMGAVVAARSPLSAEALQSLHGDALSVSVKSILQPLSPLLLGSADTSQPIHVLHQSMHNFITVGAEKSQDTKKFHLSKEVHNEHLALLCIEVLDRDIMDDSIIGVGYLDADGDQGLGIPKVFRVSEVLWYACQFWTTHIIEAGAPVSLDIETALHKLTCSQLTRWMEIVTSKGQFRGFLKVYDLMKVSILIVSVFT